ncbi:uncharacterized protein LOC115451632 isoform X2 [Manduca sexta]|uniref:Ommochrome-binding protein n=2 Tax=Manduca sexta TaxID=7130 RepID=A0A921ZRQ0_MANSE|nr:uncharacterized protein LOC115451632 isoform X2 [Manduca sexta]XP_037292725.1 uncharacterized protein LOC115451632 isoform X2 [Manduca sexta]KAG6462415.1 hypothetical protein O3G_MSEX013243 [Manduca sexta]KAG6462416.1 hypothetical protein O3G_MSEX013243 [Manduca sexta]
MKLAILFSVALLALAAAAPTKDVDDTIVVTSEFFPDALAVYTSQHDIVSLTVPLNKANFEDDESLNGDKLVLLAIFVEADINDKGEYDYKGLYTLKGGNATKILETGTDSASDKSNSRDVFLSATDGLYVYKYDVHKVEKYGSVNDNLVGIAKVNSSEDIFVLSADHVLYKVSENGKKKEVVKQVKDARKIVLDFSDNLYYYDGDKQVYVLSDDGVKKIEGLPANPSNVAFVKPPSIIKNGVIFISDRKSYTVYVNGTSEFNHFVLEVQPTAFAMEGTIMQYFAYQKKIYEYTILVLINSVLHAQKSDAFKKILENKSSEIESIATRSRGSLRA